jgi:hypothetical protein
VGLEEKMRREIYFLPGQFHASAENLTHNKNRLRGTIFLEKAGIKGPGQHQPALPL